MKRKGTAYVFKCLEQTTLSAFEIAESSFKDKMDEYICNPYAFKEGSPAMNKEQSEKARLYLRKCLKEAGMTAVAIDKNGGSLFRRVAL